MWFFCNFISKVNIALMHFSDDKKFELVESDREYDTKMKFYFIVLVSVESDTTFIINFVFKDVYGISSGIIKLEIIYKINL